MAVQVGLCANNVDDKVGRTIPFQFCHTSAVSPVSGYIYTSGALTLQPATYVFESSSIRYIVQEQCSVSSTIVHWRLRSSSQHHIQRTDSSDDGYCAHHTTKALLASGVPELQPDLDSVYTHFLCNKERAGCGCCVLRIKFVLGISVQQAGFTNTCSKHGQGS